MAPQIPNIKLSSGYDMPQVGFGLWKVDRSICADVVYNAIKIGYRLFDGACGKFFVVANSLPLLPVHSPRPIHPFPRKDIPRHEAAPANSSITMTWSSPPEECKVRGTSSITPPYFSLAAPLCAGLLRIVGVGAGGHQGSRW